MFISTTLRSCRRIQSSFQSSLYLFSSLPSEGIPVIDFEPFLKGNKDERQEVSNQIGAACETQGFIIYHFHDFI